jgi:hypothetical protein
MATYPQMIAANNPTAQPYSSEAASNMYVESVQKARRRGQGRSAMLTRGQSVGGAAPIDLTGQNTATASQLNPVAVKKGAISKSYAPPKSLYQFASGTYGKFNKRKKSYATYLNMEKDGSVTPLSSRQKRNFGKIKNMYNAYMKTYKQQRAAAIQSA